MAKTNKPVLIPSPRVNLGFLGATTANIAAHPADTLAKRILRVIILLTPFSDLCDSGAVARLIITIGCILEREGGKVNFL